MKYDLANEDYNRLRSTTMYGWDDAVEVQYGIAVISERVVRKVAYSSTREGYQSIEALCQHFIKNPDPLVVPVYDFQAEKIPNSKYDAHRYHYDMMRLGPLDQNEKDVVTLIYGAWYRSYRCDVRKADEFFKGYQHLDQKLVSFLKEVFLQGRYSDCHCGNFMKDEDDNYRIIDLEGFSVHHPLSDEKNSWFYNGTTQS